MVRSGVISESFDGASQKSRGEKGKVASKKATEGRKQSKNRMVGDGLMLR